MNQEWAGQDAWILAKSFFGFLRTEIKSSWPNKLDQQSFNYMAKERTFSGETHAGDAPILPARLAKQNTTRGFRNIIKFNTLISCGCPNSEASNLIKFSTLILCECPNSEASNLIKLSTLILCECPNSEASNLIKFSTLILHVCECPNGETSNLIKFSTLILSECPNSEANCKR